MRFFLSLALLWPASAADYARDVQPLLKRRCYGCHGPAAQMSHLRLDQRASLLAGGESGVPAIEPGHANRSLLIRYVSGTDPKLVMPPKGPRLTAEEIAVLTAWIDEGAVWPGAADAAQPEDPRRKHWAFQPLTATPVPSVRNQDWVRNPIDAFVLAGLERKGWLPNPPASRTDLLRRLYLDLLGLPPTLAEQQRFRGDFDAEVAHLLARPEYGERWARHWLDVVRYADTNGYERDAIKPSVYQYRDYVIRALNRDKPFDRFLTEQLAGDELPDANAETMTATGYYRLGPWDDEPADPAEDRFDQLDDMVSTTSQAFLGLTLGCARCHNHKFEPLSTRDYYSMVAVFRGLERPREGRTELDRPVGDWPAIDRFLAREKQIADLRAAARRAWLAGGQSQLPPEAVAAFLLPAKQRSEAQSKLVRDHAKALDAELLQLPVEQQVAALKKATPDLDRAYILEERTPPATHILIRGKASSPGPEVTPMVPQLLAASFVAPAPTPRTSGRRLALANWMTQRQNPLTARVIVNRVWQWHFGEGLVRTPSDFGVMGAKPTHPELLDWLAVWFMDQGWSLKKLHTLILSSNTYRMAKTNNAKYAQEDPENRLFWRVPYRRLQAEALLDSMLAVSGKLNPQMYGPQVYPEIPPEALEGSSDPGKIWAPFDEPKASRRAIYFVVKRSLMVPLLEVLDLCDTARSAAQRQTTSVAPQALQLFNGAFVNRQAKALAERLRREAGPDAAQQIDLAYRLALARAPSAAERNSLTAFLREQSLEELCRVLFNLNEFAYAN
ncbi:MAG: PSD1 and planctomycete cytochrome C domain-containing protein [Bryobacteraceae bacterium]|nr:PSD1 and planctomycete cytochrome C domain-containing protein [Bryobacteraceae bacterium]